MKRFVALFALVVLLAVWGARSQQQNSTSPPQSITTQQLVLATGNPIPAPSPVTIEPNIAGSTTYYYWIVTHSGSETSAPAGPFLISNAPSTLGGLYSDSVTWTQAVAGATYDLLRTTTTATPTGSCGCAVSTGITNASFTDGLSATTAYTVSTSPDQTSLICTNAGCGATTQVNAAAASLLDCTPPPPTNGTVVTAPCGPISIPVGTFALTSALTINGNYVQIHGKGMDQTILTCSFSPCITFNRSGSYWPANGNASVSSADGGLYDLTIECTGSGQIAVEGIDASGLALENVRTLNCTGTGAHGVYLENDSSGYTERTHFENLTFDNDTIDFEATSSSSINNSFGHNFWRQMEFILNDGQTAFKISGYAGIYSSIFDGVCNTNPPNTSTYTCVDIVGSNATFSGFLNLAIDNGGAGTVTPITGNTSSNWKTWGYGLQNGAPFATYNYGQFIDADHTGDSATGLGWRQCTNPTSCTVKMQAYLDGAGGISFWDGSTNLVSIDPGGVFINGNAASTLIGSGSVAGSTTALAANSCGDTVTLTVSGAASGNEVLVTPSASPGTSLMWKGWISSSNTVSVSYCNPTTGSITPTSATLYVEVQK